MAGKKTGAQKAAGQDRVLIFGTKEVKDSKSQRGSRGSKSQEKQRTLLNTPLKPDCIRSENQKY